MDGEQTRSTRTPAAHGGMAVDSKKGSKLKVSRRTAPEPLEREAASGHERPLWLDGLPSYHAGECHLRGENSWGGGSPHGVQL